MRNLKDEKTKIYPSTTRRGKELPSSSALDSPSVLSKLATPKPASAINSDMTHVNYVATSAVHDTYDETPSMLDTTMPLGQFLDEQLIILMKVMMKILPLDMNFLLCLRVMLWMKKLFSLYDRSDLKKLLTKLKEKSLNARMKYDPAFATSPIFITDRIMISLSTLR